MAGTSNLVGIDIGTTTIRCVIGTHDDFDEAPKVIGVGVSENIGMRKGAIIHIPDVVRSIDIAIGEAERMAGTEVESACVTVNGVHIQGIGSRGVIAVSASNREISPEDLMRVEEAATVVQLPANREIIHIFPRSYRLDGQENIKDPSGMSGVRLEVDAHVITAATPMLRNVFRAVEETDTRVERRTVPGLADAHAVLTRQQKESGVMVLDIGGGTSNIAVFEEGDVQHVAVLPVGGINITNDLAIGLKTDLDVAEAVKREHASALKTTRNGRVKEISVTVGDQKHTFKAKEVSMIVQARLDEIFDLVVKELKSIERNGRLPGGVVMVGGTANLHGIDEYAKERLGLPARIRKPSGFSGITDQVDSPEFAAAVGLMMMCSDEPQGRGRLGGRAMPTMTFSGVGDSIGNIFKKFKP